MKVLVCSTILLLWAIFLGSHSVNEKLSPVLDNPASPNENEWLKELLSLIKNEPNKVMDHIKKSKYGKMTARSLPNRPIECLEPNVNYVSMKDISSVPGTSDEFMCQRMCALYSECKYFSYNKNTSDCYLKAVHLKAETKSGFVSGSSACCAEMSIVYQGRAENALDSGKYQDCHHSCQNSPTCNYWNFNLLVNRCFLQPEIEGFTRLSYQVSGPKYCCFEHGTLYRNMPSFDIGQSYALSNFQCQKACTDNPSCRFWSYNTYNGICILKSAMRDRVVSFQHTSGSKLCRSKSSRISATGCEGDRMSLFCPQPTVIKIINASYGRTNASVCFSYGAQIPMCGPLSVTDRVQALCQGLHGYCHFWVLDDVLGIPCRVRSHNYVQVEYECLDSYEVSQIEFQHREFMSMHCQESNQKGQVLTITCQNYSIPRPSRLNVEVISAVVGQMNGTRCVVGATADRCYSFNILNNVTDLVRQRCANVASCSLNVDDAYQIAGGSCPAGNLKYMKIQYKCAETCENVCPKMRQLYKGAMFCSYFSQFLTDRKYSIIRCLVKSIIQNSGRACCDCYAHHSMAIDQKFSNMFRNDCAICDNKLASC